MLGAAVVAGRLENSLPIWVLTPLRWTSGIVSLEDGRARQLTSAGVDPALTERLAAPEKIAYESFDGLVINAYLYSPRRREGG